MVDQVIILGSLRGAEQSVICIHEPTFTNLSDRTEIIQVEYTYDLHIHFKSVMLEVDEAVKNVRTGIKQLLLTYPFFNSE